MPGADLLERGAAIENEQNAFDRMVQEPYIRGVFVELMALKGKCFGQMDERKKGKKQASFTDKKWDGIRGVYAK